MYAVYCFQIKVINLLTRCYISGEHKSTLTLLVPQVFKTM